MMPLSRKVETPHRESFREELEPDIFRSTPILVDLPTGRGVNHLLASHTPALQWSSIPQLPRAPLEHPARPETAASVFECDPAGLAAEQFRLMQRRLANLRPDGGSVLLTSPGTGDGKSLNAHNLAWALAEANHNTLLLELDLRRPSQAKYLRANPDESIVSVLNGSATSASAVRHVGDAPLYFIGQGYPVQNPSALLRSDALRELMSWALRNFAWVVVDAPPVLPIADVEELLPIIDLVLLVVRERATPRGVVQRAAERLGNRLNYLIFNDVALSSTYGYGYAYS